MRKLLFAILILSAPPALAQAPGGGPSYEQALAQVRSDESCEFSTWPLYDIYFCRSEPAMWYFARPEHQGYPGYVKRRMEVRDGATYMVTSGRSDGADDQQAAFQQWMQQVGESLQR